MKTKLKSILKSTWEYITGKILPIRFELQKDKNYVFVVLFASILAGLLAFSLGISLWFAPIIALITYFTFTVKIHVKDETQTGYYLFTVYVWSLIIFTIMQIAISPGIHSVGILKLLLNVIFVSGLVLLFAVLTTNVKFSVLFVMSVSMILGIADNFVVQTRNMEIQFSDIFALGTAATVAGGYKYTLMSSTIFSLFLLVSMILTIAKTKFPRVTGMRRRLFSLLGSAVSCLLVIVIVSSSTGLSAIKYIDKYWSFRSSQYNGFYLSLIRSASAAKVDEPHGYSSESLQDLLNDYLSTNPTKPVDPDVDPDNPDKKKPNVIVIMNETFSDLQAISQYLNPEDPLQTDVNVLEYYNSLTNEMPNVSKGYLLASVYGGNTANSEFEFLTGNTMAFLPLNTVAYNLYLNENNSDSVVNVMNANGYRTVAMHPAPAKNWSRNYVYQWLGFDQSYFIDDFEDYETYRSETSSGGIPLVTDECVYDKIIEEYENKSEDTPLFTFAVTIQNHGGYSTEGFEPTVNITNSDKYTGAEEYLSCIKKSDEALKEFLEYFQNQEEDTLVVFYGDHQPSLSNSFYSRFFNLAGDADNKSMQAKYAVPYMFWGNFDFEDEERELSSINFLAPRMLDIIGVQKTRYFSFIQNLSKSVTAINPYGWWSQNPETFEYEYHILNMSNISEESPMLQVYYWQQYNLLFDEGNKLEDWFTTPVKKDDELDDTVSP